MAYYSLPLRLAATVYIQAPSASEARSKLEQILAQSIGARDKRWFSGAPYGLLFFPEFSFSTAMTLFKPERETDLTEVDLADVHRLMLSTDESTKSKVLPYSPDWFGEGKLPIFTVDLSVETTGIVKKDSLDEAREFVAGLQNTGVHWEVADDWFEIGGLQTAFPLILSPTLNSVSIAAGCEVTQRWPERKRDYVASAAINATLESLGNGFKPLEVYALSRNLKSYFNSAGMSFSLLTDEDVLEIAGGLIAHLTTKRATTTQQGDPEQNGSSPTLH